MKILHSLYTPILKSNMKKNLNKTGLYTCLRSTLCRIVFEKADKS